MIRRVFMATINADHPQIGMIHAFDTLFGRENSRNYDYLQRMREGCRKEFVNEQFADDVIRFKPDWMWLQLQNTDIITAETLTRLEMALPHCVITHWCGDVRSEVGDYFASICRATHLTLVANSGFIPKYMAVGARQVLYVPHGLDWQEDVLFQPDWTPPFEVPDVVYCGNHYGPDMVGSEVREACVRALHEAGIKIGVVGRGWEKTGLPVLGACSVKQQVHVYRKAKVVLSVNHFPDLAGYHGDRTITSMASGTAVVQRWFPNLEDEFRDGTDFLVFRDEKELVEKTRVLLDNEDYRKVIGMTGREFAIRRHSWISRVLDVLPRVEEVARNLRR